MINISDGKIIIDVLLDDGSVVKGVASIDKQLSGLQGSGEQGALGIGKIVSALGLVALAAGAIGLVKGSIQSAFGRIDTMESFERVMTVITGSTEQTNMALDRTRDAVTGTAYGLDVAAQGVQNFVTRGVSVEKATDRITAWGDAVAFYGDGSNAQLANVTDALAKMTTKGTVGMDQMNRLFDAGIDAVGMYAKATGRTAEAVQKDLSKGKISSEDFIDTVTKAMMEGTNGVVNIAGAAKEAGASWGGSFDNMKAAVTRGVVGIIEQIDLMLVNNSLPSMRDMVADFGRKFESALKLIATNIPIVVEKIKEVYKALEPWLPLIVAVVAGVATFITIVAIVNSVKNAIVALKVAWALLNTTILASPIALVIAAIVAAAILVYVYWEPIKAFFIELWSFLEESGLAIWEVLKETWALTVTFFIELWATITEFFSELWTNIAEIASSVWEGISESWTSAIEGLKQIWEDFKTAFIEKSTEILDKIVEIWEAIDVAVYTIVGTIVGLFIPTLVAMATSAVVNAATVVASWVSMAVSATANAIKVAAQWVVTSAAATAAAIVHAVQAAPAIIASFVSLAISATANAIKVAAQWVVMSAAATASALIQGVQAVGSVIAGFLSMAVGAAAQAIRVVASWVSMGVSAIAAAALHVAQAAIVVGGWVLMGVQSMAQAARMAAAWLIAMGPVAWVTALVVGLAVLIIANWDKIRDFTIKAFTAISTFLTTIWSSIKTKVVETASSLVSDALKIWETLKTKTKEAFMKIVDSIIKPLKGIDLKSIGTDIIMGLVKGISSMIGAVGTAIKNVGTNIKDTFTSFFGIKSPSRLMMGYGEDIGDGAAIGIDSTKKANEKAIKGVSKAVADVAKKNAKEMAVIYDKGAKDRNDIVKAGTEKVKDLETKSAQSIQAIINTANSKRRKLTADESEKIENIRKTTSDKIVKIEIDSYAKGEKAFDAAWATMEKKESERAKSQLETIKTFVADKKSLEQLSLAQESEVWRTSLDLFEEGTKERVEAQKAYQASLKEVNDNIVKVNDEYAGKMQVINDNLKKQEEDLTKEYEKSLQDRTAALTNFVGIFDFFEVKIEKTGADLLENLKSQVSGFTRWQQDIDELSHKAIDKGLLDELRAMGPKALPELIALNSMTDKQLSEYSELYKKKSELARKQAETELIGMKTDTQKRITELRNTANTELETLRTEWVNKIASVTKATDTELKSLKQIGKDAGQGLLNGLASMEGSLVSKARSIAESVKSAMANALDIHSPSRWMENMIGKNMMLGWAVGIDKEKSATIAKAKQAADWMKPDVPKVGGFVNKLRGVTAPIGNVISGINPSNSSSRPHANENARSTTASVVVHLNYRGDSPVGDVNRMVDMLESELGSRLNSRLRRNGVKG